MTDNEMAAMMGAAPAANDRPEWLTKKPKGGGLTDDQMAQLMAPSAHSLDSLSADIANGKAALATPSGIDRLVSAAKGFGKGTLDTGGESIAPGGREGWGKIRAEQAAAGIDPNSREANDPMANDWGAQAIVSGIAGGAAGKAIGPLASRLGPFSKMVTGAAEGAVSNQVQGGDAGTGALIGGAMGVPSAVSAGARSARTALRNPTSELGRTIRTLDEAKASGIVNDPAFRALPKGAEGFNQTAGEAEQKMAVHGDRLLKQARQDYGQSLETILQDQAPEKPLAPLVPRPSSRAPAERAFLRGGESFDEVTNANHPTMGGNTVASPARAEPSAPAAERHYPVLDTHNVLDRLESENMVNGEVIDEHLAKAIGKTRRMLTKDTGVLDVDATRAAQMINPKAPAEYVKAPVAKVGDLLKVKQAVAKLADYGLPATPETRPYRILDKTIGKDLEAIDPRIAEMNQHYSETMGKLEEANDILYGSQNPDIVRSTAKQKRARGLLGRVGDSTQAATLARDDIERLKALDPAYREAIAPVEAKKAIERTRFGLPHVSRRIEHLPFAAVMQNLDALGARVVDPLLGRIGDSSAHAPTGALALFRAAQEKQRREQATAATLTGGQ